MAAYFRPSTLAEALAIRAERPVTVLAGGTDVYPERASRIGWGDMREPDILDIGGIDELRQIDTAGDMLRFGALVTWTGMRRAALPPAFDGYRAAAREVGGVQVQNRGTPVGNICTASPAGDGMPCLLTLDARVELASLHGRRTTPVEDFIDGYRHTTCADDEIVTGILVPRPAAGARGGFLKLGARRYLVISIVMAAGVIALDGRGLIVDARVAVGACSPVAQRLPALEAALRGAAPADAAAVVSTEHLAPLAPIDDVRGSAVFRNAAVLGMLRDLVAGLAGEPDRKAA